MKMSVKSNSSVGSFRTSVALLILGLEDLSLDVSEVLKNFLLLLYSCVSVRVCFRYLGVPVCVCAVASLVSDPATPWTVAFQAPLSLGFSRQE